MDKRIQNIGLFVLLPAGDPRIFSVSETWQIEILFFDFIAVCLFVLGQGAGSHFSALDAAYLLVVRLQFQKPESMVCRNAFFVAVVSVWNYYYCIAGKRRKRFWRWLSIMATHGVCLLHIDGIPAQIGSSVQTVLPVSVSIAPG